MRHTRAASVFFAAREVPQISLDHVLTPSRQVGLNSLSRYSTCASDEVVIQETRVPRAEAVPSS